MLSDGDIEAADVVVIGVGVTPRVELAAAAGLKVDNGDRRRRAPAIQRTGRVRRGRRRLGLAPALPARHLRVEHWANALNQGATAGRNAAGGTETLHAAALLLLRPVRPGHGVRRLHADPGDAVVVRGDLADREFIAFWHRDGIVTAAMNVNVWDVVEDLKAIVAGGTSTAARRPDVALADPACYP